MSSAIETHSPDSIYLPKVSKETLERGMKYTQNQQQKLPNKFKVIAKFLWLKKRN